MSSLDSSFCIIIYLENPPAKKENWQNVLKEKKINGIMLVKENQAF